MWFRFRRRISAGPIKLNLSRHGVGGSTGFRGFRIGFNQKGNFYISFGFPGTGISFYKEFGDERKRK